MKLATWNSRLFLIDRSIFSSFFSGPRKIRVKLAEPEMVGPHSLFTKFRVQWSKLDSFNVVHGDSVVFCSSNEGRAMECIINGKKILILREPPLMTSNLFRSFFDPPYLPYPTIFTLVSDFWVVIFDPPPYLP